MTCEVVVMNRYGAALAADSAVSSGHGEKIYHNAQKLFCLRPDLPVGIMVSGSAEIMGIPWEIIIRSFARQLGARKFSGLEQYARAFLKFVEVSRSLFPESVQRDWFLSAVASYWRSQLLHPLETRLKRKDGPAVAATDILKGLLDNDRKIWRKYPEIEQLGSRYGAKIVAEYSAGLNKLEKDLFQGYRLNARIRNGLRNTVKSMYTKAWFHPQDQTWIAFAGMGEVEPFPVLQVYRVGTIAAGKLRAYKLDETRITRKDSAVIVPLAQADMIEMFCRGIEPELERRLGDMVAKCAEDCLTTASDKVKRKQIAGARRKFEHGLQSEIRQKCEEPLMSAVDMLPRHDLTKFAEALVNLMAFRMRMSADRKETVGGALGVALLSKAEGFVWTKPQDFNQASLAA